MACRFLLAQKISFFAEADCTTIIAPYRASTRTIIGAVGERHITLKVLFRASTRTIIGAVGVIGRCALIMRHYSYGQLYFYGHYLYASAAIFLKKL